MIDDFEKKLRMALVSDFKQNKNTLSKAKDNQSDLTKSEIVSLSDKLLSLPHESLCILLGKHCFGFSMDTIEALYGIYNSNWHYQHYTAILCHHIHLNDDTIISDSSLKKICKLTLKKYLNQEFYTKRIHILNSAKKILIAAIIASMSFSTILACNSEIREKIFTWIVRAFEKYSIFELKSSEKNTDINLELYFPNYIPEGFTLTNTVFQPTLVMYEYENEHSKELKIIISISDTKIYVDTEGADLSQVYVQEYPGFFFQKDNLKYVIFEKDGYSICVYSSLEKNELLKIAESI